MVADGPPDLARPWGYLAAGSVLLFTLAAPALSLNTGFPDAGDNPTGQTERKAYDLLADGFGPGFNAPCRRRRPAGHRSGADDVPDWPSASRPTPASRRSASHGSARRRHRRTADPPQHRAADPHVSTLERVRSVTPEACT